jgi:hypothetical protein
MLTLAHFYATALALEPLYPDLGSSFCARMTLAPVEAISHVVNALQSQSMDQASIDLTNYMGYPQHMAAHFRNRHPRHESSTIKQESPSMRRLTAETLNYTTVGNMSPAFAHLPLQSSTTPRQPPTIPSSSLQSASSAAYLGVPTSQAGFSLGTQSWGMMPSPSLPPTDWAAQQAHAQAHSEGQQLYDYSSLGGFRGGFVAHHPIWT